MRTSTFSEVRRLRFQLFEWPTQAQSAMLAVLQYDFADATPAGSCWSVGLMVRLVRQASEWRPEDKYLLGDHHHSAIRRIELLDLTGDRAPDLVVESGFGGAAIAGIRLRVFDLSRGTFHQLVATNAHLEYDILDRFTQTLDPVKTLQSHGERFCFRKITYFEDGKRFAPARVANPCYPAGEGVDAGETPAFN